MNLDNLLHKKIRVFMLHYNIFLVGVLTSFDDEFLVLDNKKILNRKFIQFIVLE